MISRSSRWSRTLPLITRYIAFAGSRSSRSTSPGLVRLLSDDGGEIGQLLAGNLREDVDVLQGDDLVDRAEQRDDSV